MTDLPRGRGGREGGKHRESVTQAIERRPRRGAVVAHDRGRQAGEEGESPTELVLRLKS